MRDETATTPLISLDHEELVIRRGRRSSVYTVVAVHSTVLGPALGGCRLWRYASSADGARDALRLSRAMTYKAAACGVPLGGGKGVICAEPGPAPSGKRRTEMLLDFADTVNVLEGAYFTAEDVGTSSRDMKERSVAIVGVGRVGSRLARRLHRAGARLILADIDEDKRRLVEELEGATWSDPNPALQADVDILAPCALGGAINETNVGRLRCQIVCGSANNQLAHEGLAYDLAAADILYAPDFIVNAGGLINCAVELEGYDPDRARRKVAAIEQTMARVLEEAKIAGTIPLAAAYELARRRLGERAG